MVDAPTNAGRAESGSALPEMLEVRFAGTPSEMGEQHGSRLTDRIGACVELYRRVFGLDDEELARRAAHFEAVTRDWAPDLAAEIDAIAAGSGQHPRDIWALNSRSEIMSFTGVEATECTSMLAPQLNLLAQNWDWISDLEPLTVLADITAADGHRLVTITEPGMVGKVGLSSAGVAVGLNFLYSPHPLPGVPVHVLLRRLLDERDPAAVHDVVASAGPGRSAHVFLAVHTDGSTVGTSYEFTGLEAHRKDSADRPLLHTNHFLLTDGMPQGTSGPNSTGRHDRAVALLESGADQDLDAARSFLDDDDGSDTPICRVWAPSPSLPGIESGTVCAVMADLGERRFSVRRGPDPAAPWQHVELSA